MDMNDMNKPLTKRQQELKDEFTKARGYWYEEVWGPIIRLDEDYFEAYMKLSSAPWKKGPLPPKIKELIYVAIDSSCTHPYNDGTRVHMENAIRYGATVEEIMEVLELTSVLGVHTLTESVSIMLKAFEDSKEGFTGEIIKKT